MIKMCNGIVKRVSIMIQEIKKVKEKKYKPVFMSKSDTNNT